MAANVLDQYSRSSRRCLLLVFAFHFFFLMSFKKSKKLTFTNVRKTDAEIKKTLLRYKKKKKRSNKKRFML